MMIEDHVEEGFIEMHLDTPRGFFVFNGTNWYQGISLRAIIHPSAYDNTQWFLKIKNPLLLEKLYEAYNKAYPNRDPGNDTKL